MDFWLWLLELIRGLFSKPSLTHTEEPMNPMSTVTNTDINAVITKWLTDWNVPAVYHGYWKDAIDVMVFDTYPPPIADMLAASVYGQDTPATTWETEGRRHLAIKAPWLNPGVIAHEQAHNSYALLVEEQKEEWAKIYEDAKINDKLVRYLFSRKPYGGADPIEGHADIYRFLGDKMPENMKAFYIKLF